VNRCLLDTNILLRAVDPASAQFSQAIEAVGHLLETGWECVLTPQVVIEFWVVATRPNQENGLGWTVEQTAAEVTSLLNQFALLEDNSQIFTFWMDYVTAYFIKGKRVHDIRIQAVMKTYQITHLLTFNSKDFLSLEGFVILHPDQVVSS